ncbi:MAG: hypothetical protein LBB88_06490 [Planctomycetaceae bacterium]|jgi:hypothetical protein|nr:hypothetical protein [Planctomycetaceae bacterium]
MNISTNNFSSLFSKLSDRYRTVVSSNAKSINTTIGLQKKDGDAAEQKSDTLTLRNNKITSLSKSTYIPPAIARRLNLENVNQEIENQEIEKTKTDAENTKIEITQEKSTAETSETTKSTETIKVPEPIDSVAQTDSVEPTDSAEESIIDNIKSGLTTSPKLIEGIFFRKKECSFITPESQMKAVIEKYGGGSIGKFLFEYDKTTHKNDMEKFIADRLVELKGNSKQIIPGQGTTNYTFDTRPELETEYWIYLSQTGKSFYADSSQENRSGDSIESETVFFRQNDLLKTRSIGYVNIDQNININAPKNNSAEEKNIIQNLLNNAAQENFQKIKNGEKPYFFMTDPSVQPNEQAKQGSADIKSIMENYLNQNNITLDSKEGFIITMLDNGTLILEETNINDPTKKETIKNLIETDKTFQQEIIKIFANDKLFQK